MGNVVLLLNLKLNNLCSVKSCFITTYTLKTVSSGNLHHILLCSDKHFADKHSVEWQMIWYICIFFVLYFHCGYRDIYLFIWSFSHFTFWHCILHYLDIIVLLSNKNLKMQRIKYAKESCQVKLLFSFLSYIADKVQSKVKQRYIYIRGYMEIK